MTATASRLARIRELASWTAISFAVIGIVVAVGDGALWVLSHWLDVWQPAVQVPVASVAVLLGGFAVMWRTPTRRVWSVGLGGIAVFALIAALDPGQLGPAPVSTMIGGVTMAFDLSILGMLAAHELRVWRREPRDSWAVAADWLSEHGALIVLAHVTIVVAIIHGPVFNGPPIGDDLTFHMAESRRIADCLRVGDFDFWNPSANAGYASAYYYQVIPQLVSAVPAAIFGHLLFWFQLSVFVPLVLAPLAAYKGMRLIGATPWQAVIAAFVVAFINGESRWGTGNAGTFRVGLYTQTWALAAFPLALGYGVRWLDDAKQLAPALAWGAFVGLCHPFAGIAVGLALASGWFAGFVMGQARQLYLPAPLAVIPWAICRVFGKTDVTLGRWIKDHVSPVVNGTFLIYAGGGLLGLGVVMSRGLIAALPGLGFHTTATLIFGAGLVLGGVALIVFLREYDVPWRDPEVRARVFQFHRLVILGAALIIATVPGWITLLVDYSGFGGFPHRVNDEIGPGFKGLLFGRTNPNFVGYFTGGILDYGRRMGNVDIWRAPVFTWLVPFCAIFARGKYFRWLWTPAAVFALLLGLGPHLGQTQDDLFPMVRFLGAMQITLALAVGAGTLIVFKRVWDEPDGSWLARFAMIFTAAVVALIVLLWVWLSFPGHIIDAIEWIVHVANWFPANWFDVLVVARVVATVLVVALVAAIVLRGWRWLDQQSVVRTVVAAAAAAMLAVSVPQGFAALISRVGTFGDRAELAQVDAVIDALPPGRKQAGEGAGNHWWNMLPYVFDRIPGLLQMGGGGLQASPNYDFLWTGRDTAKNAWIYDAPYYVNSKDKADKVRGGDVIATTAHYQVRRFPADGLVAPVRVIAVLPAGTRKNEPGHKAALDWLRSQHPTANEVMAYDGYGQAGDAPAGSVLRWWRQDSPGDESDIVAKVHVDKPTTFVIRESWHPRWHAYIDGDETFVRRVTPDFLAVDAPVGEHTIEMRFERPWWANASWLMWPATCLAAWWITRRRRDSTPSARVVAS